MKFCYNVVMSSCSCRSLTTSWQECLLPAVVLWLVAAGVVLAYYFVPGAAKTIEPVARWQREGGWTSAFLNRFVFCGLLPGAFLLLRTTGRPNRIVLTIMVQMLFAGFCGIICDWMYNFHAWLLGEGVDICTVALKTILNQFVWTPVLFVPMGSVVYFWMGRDLSFRRTRAEWPPRFFADCYLPNLLTNWIVWIPVAIVVHLFPTALQIQLSGLASAVLSLAFIALGRRIGCD